MPKIMVQDNTSTWRDATTYTFVNGWDNLITDVLQVRTTNLENNKDQSLNTVGYISTELAPDTVNLPTSSPFLGYRIVLPARHRARTDMMITVVVFEQYPQQGRIWINTWNGDVPEWVGWKCISPVENLWPVGAIYISTQNTSPASKIGGTWAQLTGAVLRAANNNGYFGSDNMTLSVAQMPSHKHGIWYGASTSPQTKDAVFNVGAWGGKGYGGEYMDATGGGQSFSKLPRYYNLYAWKRTA